MSTNVEKLYKQIEGNPEYTQLLFRQALQDPEGALKSICELGESIGLKVTSKEVKEYLSTLDDPETKQWLIKARGGL